MTPSCPNSSPNSAAVSVAGLTKTYGGNAVVDRLSFEIPRGVVAGFVGPNGAGKSTTMAMLLGLVRPTVAGMVRHDDVVACGELVHERQDDGRAARAVEEDDGSAFAGAPVVRLALV